MKVIKCGGQLSAIIKIARKIKNLSDESGNEYLPLNRGVNSVCNINLTEVIKKIDFNTDTIQAYPPAMGRPDLKEAINHTYFGDNAVMDNIKIVGGSTMGLDIAFQVIDMEKVYIPAYYWTTYDQIIDIRGKKSDVYSSYTELNENLPNLKNAAVVISDPGNPVGDKYDDNRLLELVRNLNANGTVVIVDGPYRRMFFDETDTMYKEYMTMENVVIIESFSKWIGLSGQRIGFVYSPRDDFNHEFGLRLAAATNGINSFSQVLVQKLLTTPEGKMTVNDFKQKTLKDMALNIEYLRKNNLLAEQFYRTSTPVGIFVVVNKTEEELLEHRIGSISLRYFTRSGKTVAEKVSRICVSFPHDKFKRFFSYYE
jgi:aspartate aminotransferase